jgi:hypothetical protein
VATKYFIVSQWAEFSVKKITGHSPKIRTETSNFIQLHDLEENVLKTFSYHSEHLGCIDYAVSMGVTV